MMRVPSLGIVSLAAVGCLVLGIPSALATTTCGLFTQSELPNGGLPAPGGGLPSGDTFVTAATGVTPLGSLNGNSGGYPLCTTGSTYFIPFYLAAPANVSITIAEDDPHLNPDNTYFDLIVNGTSYPQGAVPDGGDSLELDVLQGGISTLGITDVYQQVNGSPATDQIAVSIQFNSYVAAAVPEPATLGLLGFGAACIVGLLRRRQHPA
jgi:hypothetical protein